MLETSQQDAEDAVVGYSARILLVDAAGPFLDSTARFLLEAGYDCEIVDDLRRARRLLLSSWFDLLITDINPASGGGIELIRHAQASVPGLPVIVVTESPSLDSAIQSIELPVVGYLKKSAPVSLLHEKVRSALRNTGDYRALLRIQTLLRHCAAGLGDVRPRDRGPGREDVNGGTFVPMSTLQTLGGCLGELVAMETTTSPDAQVTRLCELLQCPVWRVQRNAIQKCILLLQETKRRFKSKELAQVRETLEHLRNMLP
jgi:DNA-binding response OmpR family regulator